MPNFLEIYRTFQFDFFFFFKISFRRLKSVRGNLRKTMDIQEYLAAENETFLRTWEEPIKTFSCAEIARPGYSNLSADEFEDLDDTLKDKVALLAAMIRRSKNGCIYTGAGISRSSGIPDYASLASEHKPSLISPFDAMPSRTHLVLASLINYGYLKFWIQQNHDGISRLCTLPITVIDIFIPCN